jgi:hypothetical protein
MTCLPYAKKSGIGPFSFINSKLTLYDYRGSKSSRLSVKVFAKPFDDGKDVLKDAAIERLEQEVATLKAELAASSNNDKIMGLESTLTAKTATIKDFKDQLAKSVPRADVVTKETAILNQKNEILTLKAQLKDAESTIAPDALLAAKQQEIAKLQTIISELQTLNKSGGENSIAFNIDDISAKLVEGEILSAAELTFAQEQKNTGWLNLIKGPFIKHRKTGLLKRVML